MSTTSTDNWEAVEARPRQVLGEPIMKFIDECRRGPEPDSQLIAVLHKFRPQFGFLGGDAFDAVAQLLQVPAAKVAGVASFYHFFRLLPRGQVHHQRLPGHGLLREGGRPRRPEDHRRVGHQLGRDHQGRRVHARRLARCLGTCGLAPVVMIDDEIHGQVTPDQVPALLEKYMKKARAG